MARRKRLPIYAPGLGAATTSSNSSIQHWPPQRWPSIFEARWMEQAEESKTPPLRRWPCREGGQAERPQHAAPAEHSWEPEAAELLQELAALVGQLPPS